MNPERWEQLSVHKVSTRMVDFNWTDMIIIDSNSIGPIGFAVFKLSKNPMKNPMISDEIPMFDG
jgi:hypothetical protein